MEPALTDLLQCPVCSAAVAAVSDDSGAAGLECGQGHRFDRARQGYVNLLTGKASGFAADTSAMVQARDTFLASGHYDRLASAVTHHASRALTQTPNPAVLDAGAGTGFYLSAVLKTMPEARPLAMDISKFALRKAARNLPDVLCLVWDLWRPLPVASGSLDLILDIFAPRNPAEFARALAPEGRLIVVTPLPGHLEQIRRTASLLNVQDGKSGHLEQTLEPYFSQMAHEDVEFAMSLTPADIRAAALMGPAAHHIDAVDLDATLEELPDRTAVTAAFRLTVYARW